MGKEADPGAGSAGDVGQGAGKLSLFGSGDVVGGHKDDATTGGERVPGGS